MIDVQSEPIHYLFSLISERNPAIASVLNNTNFEVISIEAIEDSLNTKVVIGSTPASPISGSFVIRYKRYPLGRTFTPSIEDRSEKAPIVRFRAQTDSPTIQIKSLEALINGKLGANLTIETDEGGIGDIKDITVSTTVGQQVNTLLEAADGSIRFYTDNTLHPMELRFINEGEDLSELTEVREIDAHKTTVGGREVLITDNFYTLSDDDKRDFLPTVGDLNHAAILYNVDFTDIIGFSGTDIIDMDYDEDSNWYRYKQDFFDSIQARLAYYGINVPTNKFPKATTMTLTAIADYQIENLDIGDLFQNVDGFNQKLMFGYPYGLSELTYINLQLHFDPK